MVPLLPLFLLLVLLLLLLLRWRLCHLKRPGDVVDVVAFVRFLDLIVGVDLQAHPVGSRLEVFGEKSAERLVPGSLGSSRDTGHR